MSVVNTKTKVITMTNHNKCSTERTNENSKKIHVTGGKRGKKACDQVAIGLGFASDWLSRWREFYKPITERSKAKPKQFCITFNTQYEKQQSTTVSKR